MSAKESTTVEAETRQGTTERVNHQRAHNEHLREEIDLLKADDKDPTRRYV